MLDFHAGARALERIREEGLHPDGVATVAGAAGGPKWLALSRFDRTLFALDRSGWFAGRNSPLHLLGSSSGAWRFAAVAQSDPLAANQRLERAYIHQRYDHKPSPSEVSAEAGRILDHLLGKRGVHSILDHPFLRLNVVTVRCRNYLTSLEAAYGQATGMVAAAILNGFNRKTLGLFFERVVFHDPRTVPPLTGKDGLPTRHVRLTPQNLKPALLASGSIPLVMSGVRDIPGAPPGVYRDGGVIDYHMDLPHRADGRLVLMPHFSSRVIPGWLDKTPGWRRAAYLDDTLLVSPDRDFLNRLPHGKIPDRNDFYTFFGRDRQRIDYWRRAAEMGEQLASSFREAVDSGRIRKAVKPYGAG